MALQKEIWIDSIQNNLYKGNEFITASTSHDAFVDNAKVNVPNSGATPSVEKNRSSFPATITERTDTILTYLLDNFTTDPIRVRSLDELQTSYDKMESVMAEHMAVLNERIGDECAFNWSPSGDADLVLRTSGSLATDNLPHGTATGQRNKMTKEDVRKMARKLDLDNVAMTGRKLLLPVTMYYELFDDADLLSVEKLEQRSLPNGVINRLFGFDIMIRPTVSLYDEVVAGVKQAVGGTENTTDCFGALAWSEFHVAKALGDIQVYANEGVAEHYGDIVSCEVQFGASLLRGDNKGIVAMAQGYSA
jgi:hypothetical protein